MKSLNSISVKVPLFLSLTAVCFLLSCANDQPGADKKSYSDSINLKGIVKSPGMKENKPLDSSGENQKEGIPFKTITFLNKGGNVIEAKMYGTNATLLSSTTWYYDKIRLKGKVKILNETQYNTEDKFGEIQKEGIYLKTITSFNESGNVIDVKMYDSYGIQLTRTTWNYDKNGKVIEMNEYNNGSWVSKSTFNNDANGNEIERDNYNPNGTLLGKIISRYNAKGKKVEENCYDQNGVLEAKYMLNYDEKGNNIESVCHNPDGSLSIKSTARYDEKRNGIESNYISTKNSIELKESIKYDDDGKVIEQIREYGGYPRKANYKYEKYDKDGNWLIKIQEGKLIGDENNYDIDGSNYIITQREIQYY